MLEPACCKMLVDLHDDTAAHYQRTEPQVLEEFLFATPSRLIRIDDRHPAPNFNPDSMTGRFEAIRS